MTIDFAQPHWLLVAPAVCTVLALLMVRSERRRRAAIARFAMASPETTVARGMRWLRHGLALVGVALLFVALARPRAGYTWEHTPRQGIDVMFAVDTSRSMRAADLRPDRLTRAKLAVADLAGKLDGDRVGLIAFAGGAFVQAPLTADQRVFLDALSALDTDVIPRGGSDLSSAIRAAQQASTSEPGNRKLLVLLSDGEDLGGAAIDAARDAADDGMTIYTIGVGSERGELIEIASPDGTRELVRDATGQPVRSRLDETTLRGIAQVSGGAYRALGSDGRGLDMLYETALAKLPQGESTTARKVYSERFQIPLALGLVCLLVELAIRDRRRRRRERGRGHGGAALVGLCLLALPGIASAEPGRADAVRDYNAGTSTYRSKDFTAAQAQFEKSLHTSDVGLQVDAYYNLGNARYRTGEQTLATDRAKTIEAWKAAVQAYDGALALRPEDVDARFNRDVVARKLASLEEENQKQDNENQQNQQDQKNQQNPQNQQDQQGQQGQQGQQNQQKQQGQQNQQNQQGQQQQQSQQGQRNQQGQQNAQKQGGQQDQDQQSQPNDRQQQGQNQQGRQNEQKPRGQPSQQNNQNQQNEQNPDNQSNQAQNPNKRASAPDATRDAARRDVERADTKQTASPGAAGDAAAAARAAQQADADRRAVQADAARRAAGQLTRTEAAQLLDSVEDELHALPIDGRPQQQPTDAPIKDW